jgi:tRNA pseudouridine55 synthase
MEIPSDESWMFLIDKDIHWTSFDVVNKIRRTMRIKKVGHAGTLDPLATGLVIICAGKATKQIESFMAAEKEYTGSFRLGETRPSHDLETEPDAYYPFAEISREDILNTAIRFTGTQMQLPPMFSALKVDGKKLYELARKGKEAERKPREINISEFEITGIELPEIHFRVVVSKGTYIRSLAYDFGKTLGSGACLSSLRRTRIGQWKIGDARTISEWLEYWKSQSEPVQQEE